MPSRTYLILMATKKHLVFIDQEKWDRDFIKKRFKSQRLTFLTRLGNYDKIKDADILSVFINSKITPKVLEKLPNLKFIATRSTGFDHIDLPACKEKGIKVSNVPIYGENTVAEHTFGLILCLSRKIYQASSRTRLGDFTIEGLMGFDLKGKTLGVVGAGNIGKHVMRIAQGFEMDVLVVDPCLDAKAIKKLGGVKVDLKTLMKKSDIVTLHCPLCKATEQLINESKIKLMKKGSLLINTARGELMDTTAVLVALEDGRLAGVGLDAVEGEQYIKHEDEVLNGKLNPQSLQVLIENHVLIKHPNVIVTPHIAFNSVEAVRRILNTTAENIENFLKGKPKNLVC